MSEFFALDKPNIKNVNTQKILDMLFKSGEQQLFDFVNDSNEPDYLYWDKVKYRQPIPKGLTKEEAWYAISIVRRAQSIKSTIKNEKDQYFTWVKLSALERFYHDVDMNTGGELFVLKTDFDKSTKQKLISRGVMEEAIASSQLEGASTSRRIAKQFLREKRKPRNDSERMILNNYNTMKIIEEDYKDKKMSMDLLFELHGMITKETLTPEGEVPRKRKADEEIFVVDSGKNTIYHRAPPMKFVDKELERLVSFANDELETVFIHPIIKAIMLHFWIGYLHPFTDGNGRMARLVFYWYLLKKGYWAFAYLPISRIIKRSPVQYSMAYIYTEQDDNDLTYFLDYNIKKIKKAVEEFRVYLAKQAITNKAVNQTVSSKYEFNERQIQLLQHLCGDPEDRTSIKIHTSVYQVTNKTAISDLKRLEKIGFLTSKKVGRNVYYYSTPRIHELFKNNK